MKSKIVLLCGVSIGLAGGWPAAAQETAGGSASDASEAASDEFLDEIIVTARRAPRSLSAIPASVTVLDQEDIDAQVRISPDLSRALAFEVPGLASRPSRSSRARPARICADARR